MDRSREKWVSVREAAILLGFSRQRVHVLINQGRLFGEQPIDGGWWRISLDSINRFQRLPGRGPAKRIA